MEIVDFRIKELHVLIKFLRIFDKSTRNRKSKIFKMSVSEKKYYRRKISSSYVTSVISIALVLFTLGFLGLVVLHAKSLSNYIKENIGFEIIMKTNATSAEIIQLQKVLDAKSYVKSTEYITKEEASRRLKIALGEDFTEILGEENNPLLPSIDVRFRAPWANNDSLVIIEQFILTNEAVKEVYYQKSLVQVLNNNMNKISGILLGFTALLLLVAIALINNTIRLAIYSNRFIIKSMQLVGATSGFIRKPFLLKSIYQGIISAVLAILLLYAIMSFVLKNIPEFALLTNQIMIFTLYVVVLIFGIILSAISTYFAVSKYLKISSDNLY
jgi:cell division transport system permease protein